MKALDSKNERCCAFCSICLDDLGTSPALRCALCPLAYHLRCLKKPPGHTGEVFYCAQLNRRCGNSDASYLQGSISLPKWDPTTPYKPLVWIFFPYRAIVRADTKLKTWDTPERYISIAKSLSEMVLSRPKDLVFVDDDGIHRLSEEELSEGGVVGTNYLNLIHRRLRTIKALNVHSTWLDRDESTAINESFWEAAKASASAVTQAAQKVFESCGSQTAFCVVQPGHHNSADIHMVGVDSEGTSNTAYACTGGCILHSVAIARHRIGADRRVFILDLDVHFGDGTAWRYYEDPNTFCASLHLDQVATEDSQYFPFLQGSTSERGKDGSILNFPLPAGAGDREWMTVIKRYVLPAMKVFKPEIVFLSMGFDGLNGDPCEAGMRLTSSFYANVVASIRPICQRMVCVLEGGYQPSELGKAVATVIGTLAGSDPPPLLEDSGVVNFEEILLGFNRALLKENWDSRDREGYL